MLRDSVKLDNYSGIWCVEPVHFRQVVDRVNSMNLTAHIESQSLEAYDATAKAYSVAEGGGGIAVIDIQGTMTKAGSSLGGGGTVHARHAIRQADNDDPIKAIILRIDSPGGNVSGTSDLADEVARTKKPVYAFVEDLCASAAMWVASQCDRIYANSATAKVGSIGTFMALYDLSAALENEGVKAVVIKAGEFKGGGFPGSAISDEQIAEWQKLIDATQAQFTKGIASGRGMSIQQAQQLVTGLLYMASDAKDLNLIDGIKTFDEVVEELRSQHLKKGTVSMADEPKTPAAATFMEIVSACPGIDKSNSLDTAFIVECQEAGLTAADVTAQYCQTLRDRLQESEQKVESLSTEITELKAAAKPKGVKAVGTDTKATSSDPVSDFESAVREEQKAGKTKSEAVRSVNRKQPELREAMVAAVNAN